ncbi:MAG: hypothetical protein H0X62_12395, partial [Bacteroidetes bacterium]|nr:hypothetical protein [Bacteroidota bacterium]
MPAPTRQNVINRFQHQTMNAGPCWMGNPVTQKSFKQNLNDLKTKLNGTGVKIVITETNICYGNDVNDSLYNYTTNNSVNPGDKTDDSKIGNGSNSFIAGQAWAEQMAGAIFNGEVDVMTFWSTVEGSTANPSTTDPDTLSWRNNKLNIGFIDNRDLKRKSTYHHYKLFSDHMRVKLHEGATQPNGVSLSYNNCVKAFASVQPPGIKIMVMNQDSNAIDFRVN